MFFCSHLSGLNFALGASYEFEPTFFGQAAGALVVLVMGAYAEGEGIALLGRVTVPVEITPLGKWTYRYAGDANGVELYRASL